jgi:hypothetical protein
MSHKYTSGKKAFGFCGRCDFRYPLKRLRRIMIKDTLTQLMVCPSCWESSHPQLQQGKYPVNDPQALRNPRPDTSYQVSGITIPPLDRGYFNGVGSPLAGHHNLMFP